MKIRSLALLFLTAILTLSACTSPRVATSAPGSGPTPVLATSANDILGTWSPPPQELYYEFNADGTYMLGSLVGDGNRVAADKGTFQFDGTRVTLVETESSADRLYVPCGDKPGIYEVQLLASDKLQFAKIEDECTARYATLSIPLDKLP